MPTVKHELRSRAYAARNAQTDRKATSDIICRQLERHPAFVRAKTVMCYLHCRSEVQTLEFVKRLLESSEKKIVIPYCTKDENGDNRLGLWHLQDLSELGKGTWGILEPPKERWGETVKNVDAALLDLIVVPGVAFGRDGARLGNGAGYYDRLLADVRDDCVLMGIAYETQLFDDIPMDAHDVHMDFVLTEKCLYRV